MEWSEAWVRGQAGWQAWKRGRELTGAVEGLKKRGAIASGVFRQGRRRLRCVAREEHGVLAVECGCPANRATGEICEHGVALVLASLTVAVSRPPKSREPRPAVPEAEVRACAIRLPEQVGPMLAAGRLQLRVEPSAEPVVEADRRFAGFLAVHAGPQAALLHVTGERFTEALEALAGHPRVMTEGTGCPVRVLDGMHEPLALADSGLRGTRVSLKLADRGVALFAWGEGIGAVSRRGNGIRVGKLPVTPPSERWRSEFSRLVQEGGIELPRSRFLEELDAWLDVFASPPAGWLGELTFEAAVPECRLGLEGSLNALEARLEWRHAAGDFVGDPDEAAADLPRIEGSRVLVRSRKREEAPARRLESEGWEMTAVGRFRLRDPEAIPLWLADALPEWRRLAEVRIDERLQHVMERLHVVSPQLQLAGANGLACELSFQTNDGKRLDPAKVRDLLGRGGRLNRTRSGAVVVIRREVSELVEPLLADLGLVSREQRFAITKAQRFLIHELQEKRTQSTEKERLKEVKRIPEGVVTGTALRSYQQLGVEWLFERLNELNGALLGDEMGLGKTIQTIASINWLKRKNKRLKVLLLVPTSLIGNWEREFGSFAPGLGVCRFVGPDRDRRREEALAADVLLTSYGTFQRDRAFHLGNRYDLVVCDEASLLRNPDGQLSRAVAKLDADRRLALTGTPVENRLEDLWSIFRFVAPGYLGGREEFSERYSGEAAGPAARRRLALRISPYYLRRTKEEVAPELPGKWVIDEWLDLADGARDRYREVARAGLEKLGEIDSAGAARMHLLTLLLRLRQICLSPRLVDPEWSEEPVKVEWVRRLLEERHESGGKTLVFSQFAGFLQEWERSGGLAADHVFRLDGSTRDRTERVARFQECRGSAVFLISLKAGGYGLNLTAADAVVHMDPWWNPAVENQATDRAHRIGQTRPVSVYRLLARDTVEERVRRIQAEKAKLVSAVTGGSGDELPGGWDEADLRALIG